MGRAGDRWDVFCRVVDNYGDIGIGWRLAKQLAAAGCAVRLVVDGFAAFARIEPAVDADADGQVVDRQVVDGVVVERWPGADGMDEVPDVVVELLGCGLPERVVDAMADAPRAPVWIDFEHLSAEGWVDGFHGLPSPHPTRPLVKHFFYPGFGPATGGLLVEPDLAARRRAFVGDRQAVAAFRRRLGLPDDRRLFSLFAYRDAPFDALATALRNDPGRPWRLVVPDGVVDALGIDARDPTMVVVPFVAQDDYDRLLWLCDANAVRGEDSFVRAQAAGRPLVWQIYRQPDDVHLRKLAAFEDRIDAALPTAAAVTQRRFSQAWNGQGDDVAAAAAAWLAALPTLAAAADEWRSTVLAATPLVERLIDFVATRRAAG